MSNGKQHARIFAEDIDSIPELSDCAWRAYCYLRIRATPGNGFWTDHATLASMMENSRIKYHRTTVSRAITQLCDANLIKRDGKTNRTRYLVINAGIDQTCSVDAQTCSVDAQTCSVDAQTCSVDAQTCSVDAQTCSVDAQTCSVDAQTCSVDAQTCSVDAQTCSVDAQAYPLPASPQAASRVPNKQDLYLEQTRDKTRNKQTSPDKNSPDLLDTINQASPQRPTAAHPKKNGHARDEAFARFWEAYPRKVAKHAARQVFDKIKLDPETLDRIVAAADAYRKKVARDGTDPQYIKHPSGWLNARRWEDEPEPEKYTLHHVPTDISAFANFAF